MTYLEANNGYYETIAERFYNETSHAHTKEEYKKALTTVCNIYMHEFTNKNILNYMLDNDMMEAEDIETIKQYYIDNAKPFQKAMLSVSLVKGNKYTILYMSEFGFPILSKITFDSLTPCKYAQYTDSVEFIYKPYKKRTMYKKYFYDCSIIIYDGWNYELTKDDTHEKINEYSYQSKYSCFDPNYLTDAIKKFGTPIFQYDNIKVRESDGRQFA